MKLPHRQAQNVFGNSKYRQSDSQDPSSHWAIVCLSTLRFLYFLSVSPCDTQARVNLCVSLPRHTTVHGEGLCITQERANLCVSLPRHPLSMVSMELLSSVKTEVCRSFLSVLVTGKALDCCPDSLSTECSVWIFLILALILSITREMLFKNQSPGYLFILLVPKSFFFMSPCFLSPSASSVVFVGYTPLAAVSPPPWQAAF